MEGGTRGGEDCTHIVHCDLARLEYWEDLERERMQLEIGGSGSFGVEAAGVSATTNFTLTHLTSPCLALP